MVSPYIINLRKKIGNDFLLLPSVTILVLDSDNKILLVRHHNNNVWVAPGGMIEPDEEPEVAAIREMHEEVGCRVRLLRTLGTYGGHAFRMQYQNGDQVAYVTTVYLAEIESGVLKPDGKEVFEVRFFSYHQTLALPTGNWLPHVLKDVFENKLPALPL